MATAAHHAAIRASITAIANGAGGTEINGINNVDVGQSSELLDTTSFDVGQYRTRILGLRDATLTLSGDYIENDPGQNILEANFNSATNLFIAFFPVRTATPTTDIGFTGAFVVQDYNLTAAVDGKLEFSMTLMQAGALTVIPP